jgi:hypothetical protein
MQKHTGLVNINQNNYTFVTHQKVMELIQRSTDLFSLLFTGMVPWLFLNALSTLLSNQEQFGNDEKRKSLKHLYLLF